MAAELLDATLNFFLSINHRFELDSLAKRGQSNSKTISSHFHQESAMMLKLQATASDGMFSGKPMLAGPSLKDIALALSKLEKKDEMRRKPDKVQEKEKVKVGLRRRRPVKTFIDFS